MICLEDLIGFCDLTPDEVHAIAEHEHIADAIAAVLGASCSTASTGPNTSETCSSMTSARQFGGTMFRMPGTSSRRCGTSCMSILKQQCARLRKQRLHPFTPRVLARPSLPRSVDRTAARRPG